MIGAELMESDQETQRLLQAARAEFIEHGFQKTSVSGISARAGVSRGTVYRRLGDKDEIIRLVTVNEALALAQGILPKVSKLRSPEARTVEIFTVLFAEARRNPLLEKALRVDRDIVFGLFLHGGGAFLAPVRALLVSLLGDATLPQPAAARAVEACLSACVSLVLAPSPLFPLDSDEQARAFTTKYLPPIVDASRDDGRDDRGRQQAGRTATDFGDVVALVATALGAGSSDPENERLLEAARSEFIDHGFRRTSVDDIARRAGVARPTIYRRLGDKDAIESTVIGRELIDYLGELSSHIDGAQTSLDFMVDAFAVGIRAARSNPLAVAVTEYEPETLSALVSAVDNPAITAIRGLLAQVVSTSEMSGEAGMRASDLMLRMAVMQIIVPTDVLPVDTDERARWFARTYFGAIIKAEAAP